jgi:hypothetical protein
MSRFGYALSDSTRSQILLALWTAPSYPSDLADRIGVSRQILSNHLACLWGWSSLCPKADVTATNWPALGSGEHSTTSSAWSWHS